MTDFDDFQRARDRAARLRQWEIVPDAILRRSPWGRVPRRALSTLGDALGCAVLFGLLWLALAILT